MSDFRIPVARPRLQPPEAMLKYLDISHRSRHYSNDGPVLGLYRQRVADYLGVSSDQVVILCNATLCLQGLVTVLSRDNWVVPDYTFSATGNAVIGAGKTLCLVDVTEERYTLDPLELTAALESDSTGAIPVMPFGYKCDPIEWGNPPNVIYDAAASFGNFDNSLSGLNSDSAAVFSVHATKVLGAGEGGIAVCGSPELAKHLTAWGKYGFQSERISSIAGTNAKMSEFNAAAGLASLEHREEELKSWQELRQKTNDISKRHLELNSSQLIRGATPYWILELTSSSEATALENHLNSAGIQTMRWWSKPLSKMPSFSSTDNRPTPVSSHLSETHVGLPFFLEISEEQLAEISEHLSSFFDE